MKTTAWHSVKLYTKNVYHDESTCTEGNNIETQYRRIGTDGRPKCEACRRISG